MQWVVRLTTKRQVTFPKRVLEALGVGPGDVIELIEEPDGRFRLAPRRIRPEHLAPLRSLVRPGTPDFDIAAFREGTYDPSLRD